MRNRSSRRCWHCVFMAYLVGTAICVGQSARPGKVRTTTGRPALQVQPETVPVDMPARISVSGIAPGQHATISATLRLDSTHVLSSRAIFRADARGRIDLTRHAPESGSYERVDSMGLIWSVTPVTLDQNKDVQPLPSFNPPGLRHSALILSSTVSP